MICWIDATATSRAGVRHLVPLREHLEGAVRDWILGARRQSDLLRRATGINGSDLEWRSLGPPERSELASSCQEPLRRVENLEERPSCKKCTATESADRSKWLLSVWCDKLRVEHSGSRSCYLAASRKDACYHHQALCYCLSAVASVVERSLGEARRSRASDTLPASA